MDKQDLRIVFMGTPDFAVASLRVLVENNYNVVGVITMPDKPSGRGHKIQYSAVKQYALEQNLTILQPENLKDETFIEELRMLNADLQIVVAFRMLPEVIWDMPRLGTFNLHASLLPQYRGAAPINWAIINGEKETGATTFFLTHEIDTGKIIAQERIPIGESDNVGKIHDELMNMGAKLVRKTVDLLLEDKVDAIPQEQFVQNETELKAAPKIFKETCRINWNQSVEKIYNHIRGLSPYPVAWSELYVIGKKPQIVKIYSSEKIIDSKNTRDKGKIIYNKENREFLVQTNNGYQNILKIQLEGKKAIEINDFLNGYKYNKYDSFSLFCNYTYSHVLNLLLKKKKAITLDNILESFEYDFTEKDKKRLKDHINNLEKGELVQRKKKKEAELYEITKKGERHFNKKYSSFFPKY